MWQVVLIFLILLLLLSLLLLLILLLLIFFYQHLKTRGPIITRRERSTMIPSQARRDDGWSEPVAMYRSRGHGVTNSIGGRIYNPLPDPARQGPIQSHSTTILIGSVERSPHAQCPVSKTTTTKYKIYTSSREPCAFGWADV